VELGVSGRNLLILLRQIETKSPTSASKGNLLLGLSRLCTKVVPDHQLTGSSMIGRLNKLGNKLERIEGLGLRLFEVLI
jgi:hypothetical protein